MSRRAKKGAWAGLWLFAWGLLALGCGDAEPAEGASLDEPRDLFVPDALLDIELELSEDDWETIRWEGRSLPRASAGCVDFPGYTYVDARVTIDGETVSDVDVRKKGFIGSMSAARPSLKLNFGRGEVHEGRTFHGEKRFTLNNNRQDPSNARQCLAYSLFAQAGVRAPRCNLAQVRVRGEDLGSYTHVEAIKKPFLARVFGDDSGNLYEGQLSDFNDALASRFQIKTNEDRADREEIEAVREALSVDDAGLLDALEPLLDLDEFITFWAMEALVGHWDGYSGNQNNFYIYHDSEDDLLHFIPWGTDGSFQRSARLGDSAPRSVYLGSELTARLWSLGSIRARYRSRLQELIDTVWDEAALQDEVDRIGKQTLAPAGALEELKAFIDAQRGLLEAELENGAPDWPEQPRDRPVECNEPPSTSGSFELLWSDTESYGRDGTFSFDIPVAGHPLAIEGPLASVASGVADVDSFLFGAPRVAFTGTDDLGRMIWVGLHTTVSAFEPGETRFHGFETFGVVVELMPEPPHRRLAVIGDGTLRFERATRVQGAQVKGSWEGLVATVASETPPEQP